MSASILTASVLGLEAHAVQVEADISPGLQAFTIVGLPDAAVQEARERVRSAMKHSDLDFPRTRVTVNLAPADLKKTGTPFDLPIALAILMAQGTLPAIVPPTCLFAGELGLDGTLRPIRGALSFALLGKKLELEELILPQENACEAAFVQNIIIRPAHNLREVVEHLLRKQELSAHPFEPIPIGKNTSKLDFAFVRGQAQAKRGLEIAAAGGHNVILQGPPGSGKTLLARTLPSILPPLLPQEALEATRIHSVAGLLEDNRVVTAPPFRAPHHSASTISLVGGGSVPRPGEISLAHRGVLFLDEFLEFPRPVLESLRQPLEDGHVTISRAQGTLCFPARFILIAAMNPCPCGYLHSKDQVCVCSPVQIAHYRKRLSGPLLDRIDLFIPVPKVPTQDLAERAPAEPSQTVQARVEQARALQAKRHSSLGLLLNAELTSAHVQTRLQISPAGQHLLKQAVERFHLSARAYFRLLKVAQTIADLAQQEIVDQPHIAEALQFRQVQTDLG